MTGSDTRPEIERAKNLRGDHRRYNKSRVLPEQGVVRGNHR